MALALPQEIATFLGFVGLDNPPALPLHVTHAIVQEPTNVAPWYRYVCRERSEVLKSAVRIVLQSEVSQLQM
jgi:hypothetical protein